MALSLLLGFSTATADFCSGRDGGDVTGDVTGDANDGCAAVVALLVLSASPPTPLSEATEKREGRLAW